MAINDSRGQGPRMRERFDRFLDVAEAILDDENAELVDEHEYDDEDEEEDYDE